MDEFHLVSLMECLHFQNDSLSIKDKKFSQILIVLNLISMPHNHLCLKVARLCKNLLVLKDFKDTDAS